MWESPAWLCALYRSNNKIELMNKSKDHPGGLDLFIVLKVCVTSITHTYAQMDGLT